MIVDTLLAIKKGEYTRMEDTVSPSIKNDITNAIKDLQRALDQMSDGAKVKVFTDASFGIVSYWNSNESPFYLMPVTEWVGLAILKVEEGTFKEKLIKVLLDQLHRTFQYSLSVELVESK